MKLRGFWVTRRGPWRLKGLKMNSEALQVAKVYRQLLKAVKKHVGKEESKKHFVDYVAQKFRDKSILSKPHSIQQEIKLARDYTFLLNSVHHQKAIVLHSQLRSQRNKLFFLPHLIFVFNCNWHGLWCTGLAVLVQHCCWSIRWNEASIGQVCSKCGAFTSRGLSTLMPCGCLIKKKHFFP